MKRGKNLKIDWKLWVVVVLITVSFIGFVALIESNQVEEKPNVKSEDLVQPVITLNSTEKPKVIILEHFILTKIPTSKVEKIIEGLIIGKETSGNYTTYKLASGSEFTLRKSPDLHVNDILKLEEATQNYVCKDESYYTFQNGTVIEDGNMLYVYSFDHEHYLIKYVGSEMRLHAEQCLPAIEIKVLN